MARQAPGVAPGCSDKSVFLRKLLLTILIIPCFLHAFNHFPFFRRKDIAPFFAMVIPFVRVWQFPFSIDRVRHSRHINLFPFSIVLVIIGYITRFPISADCNVYTAGSHRFKWCFHLAVSGRYIFDIPALVYRLILAAVRIPSARHRPVTVGGLK